VDPARDTPLGEPEPAPPAPGRVARASQAVQERAAALAERAEVERERHTTVDLGFDVVRHDTQIAGGILAGALAYRLFIWLLPAALVAVAGLGVAAEATDTTAATAAADAGLAGLVTGSLASAAESPTRWDALLIGIPLLVWATRSLLRALIAAHRLVWVDIAARGQKPKLRPTLELLGVLLGFLLVSGVAAAVRERSFAAGLVATLLALVLYVGLWFVASIHLPHGDADWHELVPGAVVVGIGVEVMHVVVAYFIAAEAVRRQGTYGSLGVAAALLLGLYILGRLLVFAAVLNAQLHARGTGAGTPVP
jgi:uncharacterized BrkB/YihY/UPF0761 family membrane protein